MIAPTEESLQQVDEQNRIARAIEREHTIQDPEPTLAQEITSGALRGYQLWLVDRARIVHVRNDVYTVPASNGGVYTVRYGAGVESCECVDFVVHRGKIACKHLTAVGIMHATRRSGVHEIRTLAAAAGDPFS